MKRKTFLMLIIFVFVFCLSLCLGRFYVNPFDGFTDVEKQVVINIRLVRVCCACLVGAALSVAGVSFQAMFRNPMASPDLLGAANGAGFGASLALFLGLSFFSVSIWAFVFGLIAVLISFFVSKASKIQTNLALILSGIMVSSLFSSATSYVKLIADTDNTLPAITYWLMGSLSSVKMKELAFAGFFIVAGFIPLFLLRWRINLLTVSEAESKSMGIDTAKLRLVVIVCSTLMTGASVAVCGMIGWIGLVVPHFSRMIFGEDYKTLIPSSALLGSVFLMITDDISRIATSVEIPLGILTSVIGAPLFLYLIVSGGSSHES